MSNIYKNIYLVECDCGTEFVCVNEWGYFHPSLIKCYRCGKYQKWPNSIYMTKEEFDNYKLEEKTQ